VFAVLLSESKAALLHGLKHKPDISPPLVQRQLWKTKTGYVRVGDIGKSLVQYRLAATAQHRGRPVNIIAIEGLRSYLKKNDAVLVQE
jgi:hypothetical protein